MAVSFAMSTLVAVLVELPFVRLEKIFLSGSGAANKATNAAAATAADTPLNVLAPAASSPPVDES